MSLEQWSRNGWLQPHEPTVGETQQLLAVVERELSDASVSGLSADSRFIHAYQGALQLCAVALHAYGYAPQRAGGGHHHRIINSLEHTLGQERRETASYLTRCARLRSKGMYDQVGVADERTADELLQTAKELRAAVLKWLEDNHPDLTVPRETTTP